MQVVGLAAFGECPQGFWPILLDVVWVVTFLVGHFDDTGRRFAPLGWRQCCFLLF